MYFMKMLSKLKIKLLQKIASQTIWQLTACHADCSTRNVFFWKKRGMKNTTDCVSPSRCSTWREKPCSPPFLTPAIFYPPGRKKRRDSTTGFFPSDGTPWWWNAVSCVFHSPFFPKKDVSRGTGRVARSQLPDSLGSNFLE